jgi:hypothetical protein
MKSLKRSDDLRATIERIARMTPTLKPHWGRMTSHQMLCHLSDSYLVGTGDRAVSMASSPLQRTVIKFLALYAPMKWPAGVKTRPEVEQGVGGTVPVDFESDRRHLLAVLHRFAAANRDFEWAPHPIFDRMSEKEWLRWGYLHADHHLRQFGL